MVDLVSSWLKISTCVNQKCFDMPNFPVSRVWRIFALDNGLKCTELFVRSARVRLPNQVITALSMSLYTTAWRAQKVLLTRWRIRIWFACSSSLSDTQHLPQSSFLRTGSPQLNHPFCRTARCFGHHSAAFCHTFFQFTSCNIHLQAL